MGLEAVADLLRCPVCHGGMAVERPAAGGAAVLRCGAGHAFDVARQGFATLTRRGIRHPGDTPPMVAARQRVHAAGVLTPVVDAVVAAVIRSATGPGSDGGGPRRLGDGETSPGVDALADIGAGTGAYAAAVVTAGAARRAVALDSSKAALQRAARAHPRVGAVGCDLAEGIPLRDGAVDLALVAFAPRSTPELARTVRPGGRLVVVTPRPEHLAELAVPLGLLDIPAGKADDLVTALRPAFAPLDRDTVTATVEVDRSTAADLALMGPLGHHVPPAELPARARGLADKTAVTVAVDVTTLDRR